MGLNSKLDGEAQNFGQLFGSPISAKAWRHSSKSGNQNSRASQTHVNGWPETDESKKMLMDQVRAFAQGGGCAQGQGAG